MRSQTGKTFEYALANQIAVLFKVKITPSETFDSFHEAFMAQLKTEQERCIKAADAAVTFLIAQDKRFKKTGKVYLSSPMAGKYGDVRDIVIQTEDGDEIGISAKNRHKAVKHSRLSATIDFGKEWLDVPGSNLYQQDIAPIFQKLERRKGGFWRDIEDKHDRFYIPLLNAFIDELKGLHRTNPGKMSEKLLQYLLGKHDFYKVVKENGKVSIHSYNLTGSLGWGSRLSLRGQIVRAGMKAGSKTTVEVIFNNGWNLSFRIHNASSRIEPSLKFDIQIVGVPQKIKSHEVSIE